MHNPSSKQTPTEDAKKNFSLDTQAATAQNLKKSTVSNQASKHFIGRKNEKHSNLKSIQLHLNKLTAFPWVLADAPLAKIDLEGNPFVKSAGYKLDEVVAKVSAETHDAATRQTLLALAIGDVPKAWKKRAKPSHSTCRSQGALPSSRTQFSRSFADALPTHPYLGQSKATPSNQKTTGGPQSQGQ